MKMLKVIFNIALIPLFTLRFTHADEFIDKAEVITAKPVVERIYAPSRRCEARYANGRKQIDSDGAILGALLGGLAGSQVGKGSGQDAAAGLGAVLGAQLGGGGDEFTAEQLLGALAGGVIGNQVGGGSGKTASTAVGAALGAALAAGHLSRNSYEIERRCGKSQTISRNVITSYEIEYLYRGSIQEGVISYKPGDTIDVLVNVEVIEDGTL